MFIRVKSAREGDPQHEFDVAEREYAAHPDLYTVVDEVPVAECRPPAYAVEVPVEAEPVETFPVKSKKK